MKQRLAPFLVLLEARYVPLLFAVAPQAYAVYLWLFPHPYNGTGEVFAVLGAIGYEAVYVGAIAWAEEERASFWTWATAFVALLFSVLVAVYVYLPQGWWSALHAGFPLVAFCYTLNMYSKRSVSTQPATAQPPLETLQERSSSSEPIELGTDADAAGQAFLEELLDLTSDDTHTPVPPLSTVLTNGHESEQPHYYCEHCGSELASKQAKGNAARFGCANLACPGRSNRKGVRRVG